MRLLFLLITLALLAVNCNALRVAIGANDVECFFEELAKGQRVGISFEVIEGGQLDIDLEVVSPRGEQVYDGRRENEGKVSFAAEGKGVYEICFSNKFSTVTAKVVDVDVDTGDGPADRQQPVPEDAAKVDEVSNIDVALNMLSVGLRAVSKDLKYMQGREQAHRNTNESTNSRVLWWSVLEFFVVVSVAIFQVYYLRRFFEVKRVV